MIEQATEGGYLSLWGVSLLLAWLSAQRLIHFAHIAAAERGWVRAPREVMVPMQSWSDPAVTVVALACGLSGLIAFLIAASNAVDLPAWLTFDRVPPVIELARICTAFAVLTFFVARVAEHPWFKMKWVAGWTAFAFFLAWLS